MRFLTMTSRAILESTLHNLRATAGQTTTEADPLRDVSTLTDAELEEAVNSALAAL